MPPPLAAPTLLDDVLPASDYRTVYGRRTTASVEAAVRAIHETPLDEARVATLLFAARTLGRRRSAEGRTWPEIGDGESGFVPLAESDREVVVGFVGRPWPGGGGALPLEGRADFEALQRRDVVRVAASLRALPTGYGTLLVAETRIAVGADAKVAFDRYWKLVGFGSGLVRKSLLRAVARHAESLSG